MTIFDFLQDIIAKKKGNLLDDIDNEIVFQPYMINRWLSMHSLRFHELSNIINRLYPVFNQKKDWYKLFLTLIPRERFRKIYYISKTKEKEAKISEENGKVIAFLAKNMQLSQREVRMYVEISGLNLKEFKKKIG